MKGKAREINLAAIKKIDRFEKKQGSCNSDLLQKVSALLEDDDEV